MRNKLLFTAAMICVEMTPFGRVYTSAQAAEGALDLYGVNDGVVNASYDSNGDLQAVKDSVSGGGNQAANTQTQTDNFAAQANPSVNGQDHLYDTGAVQLWGQSAGSLSGNNNVELNNNYLRITNGNTGQIFTGSITGETGRSGATGTSPGYVDVLKSGGLDINSGQDINRSPLTTPNVVTLSGGKSSYDGYTFIRGQGALILQGGAQVSSQGVAEVGTAKNDSASLIIDGNGSKFDLDGSNTGEGKPSSTSGVLYVANNDGTYNGQAGLQSVTDDERKQSNTLLVQNGGEASARTVVVANREGANGTVYVTGKDPSTGQGARLNVGDGGLVVAAGTGNVIVDKGATIDSKGVISFGDAQNSDKMLDFNNRTVDGHLTVGDGGTLIAGDAYARSYYLDPSSGTLKKAYDYDHTDGIVQNFGQDNRADSLAYSNGKSTFSIENNGTLANQSDGGSGTPLHTNMDVGISGNAIFKAVDASSAAAPTDPISGQVDRTGITIGGNVTNAAKGQVGNLVKTGSGTLTLLGNNSYTGTTTVQNGTLQLGGIVGSSTPSNMYEQRIGAHLFETDQGVRSLKEQTTEQIVDKVKSAVDQGLAARNIVLSQAQREALYLAFFQSSTFQNSLNQNQIPEVQQDLEGYKDSAPYKEALQKAYNDSGKIDPSSKIVLGDTGKLNLAWGVNTKGDAPDPATRETSRTIANDISGTGQLERDVTAGVEGQLGTTPDQVDSVTHLTGKVTLWRGAGSSDTALLVRKGNLAIDSVDGKTGSVTIIGKRNVVVGDDLGGKNNQLLVKDGGSLTSDGNLTIGKGAGGVGKVTVGDASNDKSAASRINLTGSGDEGKLVVGDQGVGHLDVQRHGEVDANSVALGGKNTGNADDNSSLSVGSYGDGKATAGGTLKVGTGGLAVGTGTGDHTLYKAGVTYGGTIDNAGTTDIKKDGQLSVGGAESRSIKGEASGTLIAGDVNGPDGIKSDSGRASGDVPLQLYGNGVIENRSGSDLHVDDNTTIALSDGVAADGSDSHGTFNTNGQNAYVAGKLVDGGNGAGGLTKDGQGTLYLEADNSYTGKTDVKQGTLALAGEGAQEQNLDADNRSAANNASSSEITIENGATLTGNTNDDGAAGRTVAESGGTVEANWNHSTGQLNIDGSRYADQPALTMKDGSTLSVGGNTTPSGTQLTVDEGRKVYDRSLGASLDKGPEHSPLHTTYRQLDSGLINVKGNVDLNNATINLQKNDNGRIYDGDAYHVLQATGTVTTTGKNALTGIPSAIADMPFLSPYLAIEGNAVDVLFDRNGTNFGSVGNTRNERETGFGLNDAGSNNALAHAMTSMQSTGEARRALNSLSGEIHASARTALIQDSYLLEQAVLDRLADSDCDGENRFTHGRYDLHDHRKNGRCYNDHAVLWGQAFGSMGHNASDGNASTLHHQTAGFIMGVDTPVDDHWRVGGMVAYGRSMFNANNSVNSSGNSNNISVGAYAGSHWGRLNLRLGGFYSWNLMNMRRQVQVGDFGGRQTSHYRNGTARVFGELGYKMKFQRLEFEPFAGLSYVNQYAGSFREHGVAALYGKSNDEGLLFSNFGFRTAYNFNIGKMQMRAHAMGAYRHAFGGIVSSRQERLMVGGGDMSIGGVPLSRDSAVVRAGLTAKLSDRVDLDLSYIGQYGNQSIESGATGSVRFTF